MFGREILLTFPSAASEGLGADNLLAIRFFGKASEWRKDVRKTL